MKGCAPSSSAIIAIIFTIATAARGIRLVELEEAAFLEHNDIDGGEIEELENVFPFDLLAMPSDRRDNSVIVEQKDYHGDDEADLLEALSRTVSGSPGRDYPIYSAAPNTSFSCDGLENGGFYADREAGCQSFHICISSTADNGAVLASHTFLCPNGTVFDQDGFMCDWWFNVKCNGGEKGEEEEGMTAAASDRSYYSSRSRRHLRQRGRRFPTYDVRHRTREEARPPPVVQESLLVR